MAFLEPVNLHHQTCSGQTSTSLLQLSPYICDNQRLTLLDEAIPQLSKLRTSTSTCPVRAINQFAEVTTLHSRPLYYRGHPPVTSSQVFSAAFCNKLVTSKIHTVVIVLELELLQLQQQLVSQCGSLRP